MWHATHYHTTYRLTACLVCALAVMLVAASEQQGKRATAELDALELASAEIPNITFRRARQTNVLEVVSNSLLFISLEALNELDAQFCNSRAVGHVYNPPIQ